VDLPKKEGRKWILEKLLSAHRNMFDISEQEVDSITERSAGMSPANIENVIESALREGIRNNCKVDDDMLDDAFERCRYGEENDRDSEKEIRHTAYHEAGHAVVHLHYGNTPSYMSVVSRGNFGGYVKPEKMGEHPTKEKLLQRICMSLGGRAAELECGYGLTPGASSDLQQATNLAKSMVCAYGMYEDEVGLAVISDEELRYNEKAKQVINQILSEQLKQARQIIREERENLERLVEAVLTSKQKYLTKKDLEGLYHG
jgi:ATP-dependent Zn protease